MQITQETSRRESAERIEEFGSESTLERTAEESVVDEISDHVQTAVRRDTSIGISASAYGSIGVWGAAASGSFDLSTSAENARDVATMRTVSRTKRSTEIIRKSYTVMVKGSTAFSERSRVKRTLKNDGDLPVSYGLRRVLRTVQVKLQSLGPRLVWQLYVHRPGQSLASSRMVVFRDADPAAAPGMPPNAPPRPQGGTETGTRTVGIEAVETISTATGVIITDAVIRVSVPVDQTKSYSAMVVDSITDAQPGKGARAPGVLPADYDVDTSDPAMIVFLFHIDPGTAKTVTVTYTLAYEPSSAVMAEWNTQVAAASAAFEASQQEEAFDRAKRLIVAKSRVRPRPAGDLRDEERYEIMNRMISMAFHDIPAQGLPSPVEIELFHRYFEVPAIFYYVHPAWWKPRYGVARAEYEITEDSEPARFGKSLGWLIQLDGDRRRNELLNSPWVRVCVPIRPGVERAACAWLARHIEGAHGYHTGAGSSLGKLLGDIEARRLEERGALPGPDYVTLDGDVAPGREPAAQAYPIVDQFEIALPTEGFVYEKLEIE